MNNMTYSVEVDDVTKVYQIYNNPKDRLKQLLLGRKKKFYKEFTAIHSSSFRVSKGQTTGIVGRNGSGKSTLLQMIAGTLRPSSGSIKVNGRIAALLELGSGFNPEFTGRENVYLNGAILGLSREEMSKRFDKITEFADIGDFIDQPVKTYSSGMYVRLAFAVSINVDPDILIVDEALAVGDGRFQLKCYEKIKDLKQDGTTILFVSHDLQTIRQICDEVILFDKGRLIELGNPNEVVNHYTKILYDSPSSESSPLTNEQSLDEFAGANSIEIYSENEYRYGSQEGTIEQIIVNGTSPDTFVCTSGDMVNISFIAKANKKIQNPIYAMTIKTIKGLEVYGTNSYFQNFEFNSIESGDEVHVEFSQNLDIIQGDYYVSLGFVELVDGDIRPLDRRYDVLEIKVLPKKEDRSFGLANLHSQIRLKKTASRYEYDR